MQVFKVFFKVLKKKLGIALIFIAVFMPISVNMTKSESADTRFEESSMNLVIFDEDNTPESQALTEYLGRNNKIKTMEKDDDKLMDALFYWSVDYCFTINKGYAENLAKGETDKLFTAKVLGKETYVDALMGSKLNGYVSAVDTYMAAGCTLDEAIEKTGEVLSRETEVRVIRPDNGEADYPRNFSDYYRFMPYILISVILSALAPVLLAMNRTEIRCRTNCSCVNTVSYTMQILAASCIFVVGIWLIFTIAGMVMYGGIYTGKAWIAVVNSLIFSLVSAGVAVFVSTLTNSENVITLITTILGLGMSFLCGIFVLQSLLSKTVLAAARFLPAYWYIRINDMLSGRTLYNSSDITKCLLIELAFAAVFGILAMLITKLKREKAL